MVATRRSATLSENMSSRTRGRYDQVSVANLRESHIIGRVRKPATSSHHGSTQTDKVELNKKESAIQKQDHGKIGTTLKKETEHAKMILGTVESMDIQVSSCNVSDLKHMVCSDVSSIDLDHQSDMSDIDDSLLPQLPIQETARIPETTRIPETSGRSVGLSETLRLSYQPSTLVARESEHQQLCATVENWRQGNDHGFVYISGMPGCGKTITVDHVLQKYCASGDASSSLSCIKINCAHFTHAESMAKLYPLILSYLVNSQAAARREQAQKLDYVDPGRFTTSTLSSKDAREKIVQLASQSTFRPTIIVLDELDFLITKDRMLLYSIFELRKVAGSKLAVIGISNGLDLMDRILPWLRSVGCCPHLLPFSTYTSEQLKAILRQRLESAEHVEKIMAPALDLCSKKVAAGTGDARVAIDTIGMAYKKIETDFAVLPQEASPVAVPASASTAVVLGLVSKILSQKGGSSTAASALSSLPLLQQLVLVTLVVFCHSQNGNNSKKKKAAQMCLGSLYDELSKTARKLQIQSVPISMFFDMCETSLVHHTMIRVSQHRDLRKRMVGLVIPVQDVVENLGSHRLLGSLLLSIPRQ